MNKKDWMFLIVVCCVLVTLLVNVIMFCKKANTNGRIKTQDSIKKENINIKNDVEKLEIIKTYETNKALTADDSTSLLLWKQLVSE